MIMYSLLLWSFINTWYDAEYVEHVSDELFPGNGKDWAATVNCPEAGHGVVPQNAIIVIVVSVFENMVRAGIRDQVVRVKRSCRYIVGRHQEAGTSGFCQALDARPGRLKNVTRVIKKVEICLEKAERYVAVQGILRNEPELSS